MDKIYLVIIDLYNNEENSIVDICTTKEIAEKLMNEYSRRASYNNSEYSYHIDEVELDSSKDVLWDCYTNSIFDHA